MTRAREEVFPLGERTMTEVRARSWESTASLPCAGRSIKVAALWTVVTVAASLLASVGAGRLSPLSKTHLALAGADAAHPNGAVSAIVRTADPVPAAAERMVVALGGQFTGEQHVPADPPRNLAWVRLAEAPGAADVSEVSSGTSRSGMFRSGNSWTV